MKTTQIKITDDGLFGQAVNPHRFEPSAPASINKNWIDFAANNPPYPLTKPGEPCKIVEAVLVWQFMGDENNWCNGDFIFPHIHSTYEEFKDYWGEGETSSETRQAFEVISNKEHPTIEEMVKHTMDRMPALDGVDEVREKTNCYFCNGTGKQYANSCEWTCRYCNGTGFQEQPAAEQSIEIAAILYAKNRNNGCRTEVNINDIDCVAFIAGANYILSAKGLVSKDKVVEIIRNWYFRDKKHDTANTSELTDLLTQIKNLKK